MTRLPRNTILGLGPMLLAVCGLLSGCSSSTELVNAWKDPEGVQAPMEKVLVVAIKKDAVQRQVMEDAFVSRLERHGVQATSSHDLFPEAVPDTAEVANLVREKAYDGILVASGLSTDVQREFTPGYTTKEPVSRYEPWSRSYHTYFEEVYHLGYLDETHVVRNRVDLWSTEGSGWLVWTAEGETLDPSSVRDVSHEVAEVAVRELVKHGIIRNKP